jgi:RNA polymerase sigma-32 factor
LAPIFWYGLPAVAKENKGKKQRVSAPKAAPIKPVEVTPVPIPKAKATGTSISKTDPLLQAYLREVQRYPLLTREEEHELAVKLFEHKDRDALQRLVTSNLRFVVKIAYEYVHYRAKLLDLIQEGNMGLVKAVQEFNPYKDVRLTTYAVWWIRSYIQDSILKNYSLVKMGTTQAQKKLFYRLRSEQAKLEQMGIVPEQKVKLLASRLDVREKDVEEMDQRLSGADLSLNAPMSEDDRKEHMQSLADPAEPHDVTLGNAEQRELFSKILRQFSDTLEGREKVIFSERLVSESPLTLQEIGDKYGVTKERARQIEEHIKTKLRKYVEEHYPDYELLSRSM